MTRIRTLSQDLLAKYDRRVPRYTSYPTAPQFAPSVRAKPGTTAASRAHAP